MQTEAENKKVVNQSVFDKLPDSALIRQFQLVQSDKRPHSTAPLPFSAATLLKMVEAGTFPAPYQVSKRVKVWKVGEVRLWLKKQENCAARIHIAPKGKSYFGNQLQDNTNGLSCYPALSEREKLLVQPLRQIVSAVFNYSNGDPDAPDMHLFLKDAQIALHACGMQVEPHQKVAA